MICEIIDWLHENANRTCEIPAINDRGRQNRDDFFEFVRSQCISDPDCGARDILNRIDSYGWKNDARGDNSKRKIRHYLWAQLKAEQHSESSISLSVFIVGKPPEPALRICIEYKTHGIENDLNAVQTVNAYNKIFEGTSLLPEGLHFFGPIGNGVEASIRDERKYSDIRNLLEVNTNVRYQVAFFAQKDGFPNPKNLPTFKNDEEFRQLCIKGINAILPFYQKYVKN